MPDARQAPHPAIRLLAAARLPDLMQQVTPARPVVLMYHDVSDPVGLRRQIEYLMERYDVVELDRLARDVREGRQPERPAAAVTFDDGPRSVYTIAYPVLAACACPATVFVNTECAGTGEPIWPTRIRRMVESTRLAWIVLTVAGERREFDTENAKQRAVAADAVVQLAKTRWQPVLDAVLEEVAAATRVDEHDVPLTDDEASTRWDELKIMEGSGHVRIGNHTVSHRILPYVGDAVLRTEILGAHEILQERMTNASRVFCYPNGDTDPRAARLLLEIGYLGAVTIVQERVGSAADPMRIPRIDVREWEDMGVFRTRISGLLTPGRRVVGMARAAWPLS